MKVGVALTCAGFVASSALAQEVVVIPNDNEVTPGPSNNAFPFNGGSAMRVQQIFRADQLDGMSGFVTQIAFRPDESAGDPFNSGPIDVQITLSHTDIEPLDMSLTFDDNIGSDATIVLDDSITMSSAGGSDFDIIIDVEDSFRYNGTDNLLVEYKVFNAAFTTQFDAAGTGLGEGGLATINRLWAFGADAVTGSSNGDDGYVTQLTIGGGLSLAVSGSCPGSMQLSVSGATAGGSVAFIAAFGEGSFEIPGNFPCPGTMLGLSGNGIRLLGTDTADANGEASLSGNAPAAACGRVFVQALDLDTCTTSNVAGI